MAGLHSSGFMKFVHKVCAIWLDYSSDFIKFVGWITQ